MSIIQDLYNIYDKELARYRAQTSSKNRLLVEMQHNLAFLHEGLREGLPQGAVIGALEDAQYRAACDQGIDLATLRKSPLSRATCGGIREFNRYLGWDSARLISKVYERIATLKKLAAGSDSIDLRARLSNLFKLLMVVLAHLEARQLLIVQNP